MLVAIVGLPGVGKTTWLNKNAKKYAGCKIFRADDYLRFGFEESMYKLREDVRRCIATNVLVEGVQVFRLLRKGLQENDMRFDEVILLVAKTDEIRKERYKKREGKYPNPGFDKMLFKVWNDYLQLLKFETNQPILTTITV